MSVCLLVNKVLIILYQERRGYFINGAEPRIVRLDAAAAVRIRPAVIDMDEHLD